MKNEAQTSDEEERIKLVQIDMANDVTTLCNAIDFFTLAFHSKAESVVRSSGLANQERIFILSMQRLRLQLCGLGLCLLDEKSWTDSIYACLCQVNNNCFCVSRADDCSFYGDCHIGENERRWLKEKDKTEPSVVLTDSKKEA